ncbi:SlyX protein [Thioalkalivibrio denitrificans]|uniref:Protein SlyX homolog n=1 Tax=Thioalkalivibrio denitrificans TaxID=108003 RepID=A0A1V3NQP0_9GAMM|nr:SlyX family protein [Thioalkalivibrio denitrificans]OOG27142.1 SlyX protein [Thioalkalivibrio denitrificans]
MSNALEERIVELEIRLSHQDDMLQTLNRLITEQQITIERLQADMANLRLYVSELLATQGGDPGPEPPPPHY